MIDIDALTKTFGAQRAVDSLSFTAPTGTVTGFLGPNGAGKSTTLRMLCGLTQPTSGRATFDGVPYIDIPLPGRAVGVMLDASAQHPGRTGAEVLRLAAMAKRLPASVVELMLERVGLENAARKRVGQYSLGMRQRLGIASALLGDPHTLVLDEPANGLDPEGIHWMRGLLSDFADAGGTVLLSSHLLGEVQAVADRIVVLHQGHLVTEGTTDELTAGAATSSIVDATDLPVMAAALTSAGIDHHPEGDALVAMTTADRIGQVALGSGIVLTRLQPAGDLETLFLDLTRTAA